MEIGGPVPGRIAAEEDVGSVELERVVEGVEQLGRDQVPRHEHARPLERLRLHHSSSPLPSRAAAAADFLQRTIGLIAEDSAESECVRKDESELGRGWSMEDGGGNWGEKIEWE